MTHGPFWVKISEQLSISFLWLPAACHLECCVSLVCCALTYSKSVHYGKINFLCFSLSLEIIHVSLQCDSMCYSCHREALFCVDEYCLLMSKITITVLLASFIWIYHYLCIVIYTAVPSCRSHFCGQSCVVSQVCVRFLWMLQNIGSVWYYIHTEALKYTDT